MKLSIDFDNPIIPNEQALSISVRDLTDFYVASTEVDRLNLFFVLLNTYQDCVDKKDFLKAAHISYLISYYLFTPLTPPASEPLAMHYAQQAFAFNPIKEYQDWISYVKTGN